MTGWLRMALAAQVGFFAIWGVQLMTSHQIGSVVWLATEPVDPRDLLSGHYVALRFTIAAPQSARCEVGPDGAQHQVWVQLADKGERVATSEGEVAISEPIDCRRTAPDDATDQVWIAGNLVSRDGGGRIVYGIEKMFVGEDNPLRTASSGSVVGKVVINDDCEPRLLALVNRQRPTTSP